MPTLTEVVTVGGADGDDSRPVPAPVQAPTPGPTPAGPAAVPAAPFAAAPAASPFQSTPPATADESVVAERVLRELQGQIDKMLEVRLREALAPALVRTADALVRDARRELVAALREAVERAVRETRGKP